VRVSVHRLHWRSGEVPQMEQRLEELTRSLAILPISQAEDLKYCVNIFFFMPAPLCACA
jgi:hypothetical protein